MIELDKVTASFFEPHVGSAFHVHVSDTDIVEFRLSSCTETSPSRPDRRRTFSLVFRPSMQGRVLPQRIYHLEHESIGPLDIFITPVRPDEEGLGYEAVFN